MDTNEKNLNVAKSLLAGILGKSKFERDASKLYYIYFPIFDNEDNKILAKFPVFETISTETARLLGWQVYNLDDYRLDEFITETDEVLIEDFEDIDYSKDSDKVNLGNFISIFLKVQEYKKMGQGIDVVPDHKTVVEDLISDFENDIVDTISEEVNRVYNYEIEYEDDELLSNIDSLDEYTDGVVEPAEEPEMIEETVEEVDEVDEFETLVDEEPAESLDLSGLSDFETEDTVVESDEELVDLSAIGEDDEFADEEVVEEVDEFESLDLEEPAESLDLSGLSDFETEDTVVENDEELVDLSAIGEDDEFADEEVVEEVDEFETLVDEEPAESLDLSGLSDFETEDTVVEDDEELVDLSAIEEDDEFEDLEDIDEVQDSVDLSAMADEDFSEFEVEEETNDVKDELDLSSLDLDDEFVDEEVVEEDLEETLEESDDLDLDLSSLDEDFEDVTIENDGLKPIGIIEEDEEDVNIDVTEDEDEEEYSYVDEVAEEYNKIDEDFEIEPPAGFGEEKEETVVEKSEDEEDSLEEVFSTVVGLDDIKEKIKGLRDYIEFLIDADENNINIPTPNMNVVLTGNSGTGKSEVIKILSELFNEYSIIEENRVVTANLHDFACGPHSEHKVTDIIERATNGLLILNVDKGCLKCMMKNALKSLVEVMDDIVVIFVGTRRNMKDFLIANPELASRVGYKLHLENYTAKELLNIFTYKVNQTGLVVEDDAMDAIEDVIEYFTNIENVKNAKFIGKLIDQITYKKSVNKSEITKIVEEDVPSTDEMLNALYNVKEFIMLSEDKQRREVVHEVGHAAAEVLLTGKTNLSRIISNNNYTISLNEFAEDELSTKESYLNNIKVILSGLAAEQVYLNEFDDSHPEELDLATKLANKMVTINGMSDLGLARMERHNPEMSKIAYEEVNKILKVCFDEVSALIAKNKAKIDEIVEIVLNKNEITGKDLVNKLTKTKEEPVKKEVKKETKKETKKEEKKAEKKTEKKVEKKTTKKVADTKEKKATTKKATTKKK